MNEQQNLLVIADSQAEYLEPLRTVLGKVNVQISNQVDVLRMHSSTADIILYVNTPGPLRAIFPHAKRLKWLHSLNTGVESLLFPEMLSSSVVLTNSRGAYKTALAEFVMASVLFFTKHIRKLIDNQATRLWEQFDSEEVRGKVMGIVGYGETGHACAGLARAFGMTVFALRRRPHLSTQDPLLEKLFGVDQLHTMLPACDFIVLSAPGTPNTIKMIGTAELSLLRQSAVLINVGRGTVVDEVALIKSLQERSLAGAALDVFQGEPLAPDHPFYKLDNVLLSPHCTDHVPGWRTRAVEDFVNNLNRYLTKKPLANIVDKVAGY